MASSSVSRARRPIERHERPGSSEEQRWRRRRLGERHTEATVETHGLGLEQRILQSGTCLIEQSFGRGAAVQR